MTLQDMVKKTDGLTKFYVQCGSIRETVMALDPDDACYKGFMKSMMKNGKVKFSPLTMVSKISFVEFLKDGDDYVTCPTAEMLDLIGFPEQATQVREAILKEIPDDLLKKMQDFLDKLQNLDDDKQTA